MANCSSACLAIPSLGLISQFGDIFGLRHLVNQFGHICFRLYSFATGETWPKCDMLKLQVCCLLHFCWSDASLGLLIPCLSEPWGKRLRFRGHGSIWVRCRALGLHLFVALWIEPMASSRCEKGTCPFESYVDVHNQQRMFIYLFWCLCMDSTKSECQTNWKRRNHPIYAHLNDSLCVCVCPESMQIKQKNNAKCVPLLSGTRSWRVATSCH